MQLVRRNEKWRLDYMTLEQEYRERYNEGVEAGKIELLYFDMQMTISEIAEKLSISEEQVRKIVESMKEISKG